jgi:hypothetical protein
MSLRSIALDAALDQLARDKSRVRGVHADFANPFVDEYLALMERWSKVEKFWMLYVEDGGTPNQPYLTYEGALNRAKVLAKETRKRVFIIQSVQVVIAHIPDEPVTFEVKEVV